MVSGSRDLDLISPVLRSVASPRFLQDLVIDGAPCALYKRVRGTFPVRRRCCVLLNRGSARRSRRDRSAWRHECVSRLRRRSTARDRGHTLLSARASPASTGGPGEVEAARCGGRAGEEDGADGSAVSSKEEEGTGAGRWRNEFFAAAHFWLDAARQARSS